MAFTSDLALAVALGALGLVGCGGGARFDSARPVDARFTAGGYEYSQGGRRVDQASLRETLGERESTKSAVAGSQALAVGAYVFGAAGGACIGVPLGQAAADNPEPAWAVAAVGGGLLAVAIGMALGADAMFKSAVVAHNREIDGHVGHSTGAGDSKPAARARLRRDALVPTGAETPTTY